MWKISFHVRKAHLGRSNFLGEQLEIVKGLTKANSQKIGKVPKAKKSCRKEKHVTLGQRRV